MKKIICLMLAMPLTALAAFPDLSKAECRGDEQSYKLFFDGTQNGWKRSDSMTATLKSPTGPNDPNDSELVYTFAPVSDVYDRNDGSFIFIGFLSHKREGPHGDSTLRLISFVVTHHLGRPAFHEIADHPVELNSEKTLLSSLSEFQCQF